MGAEVAPSLVIAKSRQSAPRRTAPQGSGPGLVDAEAGKPCNPSGRAAASDVQTQRTKQALGKL